MSTKTTLRFTSPDGSEVELASTKPYTHGTFICQEGEWRFIATQTREDLAQKAATKYRNILGYANVAIVPARIA
jgi:hypothetical protein